MNEHHYAFWENSIGMPFNSAAVALSETASVLLTPYLEELKCNVTRIQLFPNREHMNGGRHYVYAIITTAPNLAVEPDVLA